MSEIYSFDDVEKEEASTPEEWAIVELMGHVRLAGRLSEEERFGAKMGRLDIPDGEGFVTQFFGGGSVYRITPVSEAVARQVAKSCDPKPIHSWDFPKQIQSPVATASLDETMPGEPMGDEPVCDICDRVLGYSRRERGICDNCEPF